MDSQGLSNRANLEYIEQLYFQYKNAPQSLSADWKHFFQGVEFMEQGEGLNFKAEKELDVYHLISAYRNYGHFEAQLNPLANTATPSDQLALKKFNLSENDLEQNFKIGKLVGKENAPLKEIISHLKKSYCGKISIQAAEALPEIRDFFIREFEALEPSYKIDAEIKKDILNSLTRTEALEKFLHTRFVGAKRFSVEGADSLLPMLETLASESPKHKVEEIVIGMAHRGRINVLTNFMGKNLEHMLAEFNGNLEMEEKIEGFDGDVKYHLGYKSLKKFKTGECLVSLAFNPSHLEAVNPVVLGMTRAAQRRRKDTELRKKVVPVLIHGDAAFAGQGVVAETFQLADVKGYTVGGTIHICTDNQVGFTTSPENARSSHYASDLAKILATPVIHVSGDDTESSVRAMEMALRFRQQFGQDIVITVHCYRRFGHNEGDEPAYTQPQMYEIIKKHPTPRELYAKKLSAEGVITGDAQAAGLLNAELDRLQGILDQVKKTPPKVPVFKFDGFWQGLRRAMPEDFNKVWNTGVEKSVLEKVGHLLANYPKNFSPHPKLLKLLETRGKMASGEVPVDWGMAELLAYGSLMFEGTSVRISGQDVCRGTFTHRHAVLSDHKTGETYTALKQILPEQVEFCIYDSILSEYAVLGFEYGNSISDPTFLTIWEAQFGDFANGAQIIIDQFIASGESKWQQMTGLVMLLPHGFEGQGPEHSSARLERFLQLAAQNNIQVINPTTPSQIFHALRRQIKRPFRKPLIVMSPKILLRHPEAVSSLEELTNGHFYEILPDQQAEPKKVEQLILCSGKVYYELNEQRQKIKDNKIYAIHRIEQLYPLAKEQLMELIAQYPKLKKIVWAQEEPMNNGAYSYMYFHLEESLEALKLSGKVKVRYAGRTKRASPAIGSLYKHKGEQAELIEKAFDEKI